ncbi:MAG: hypothetical protein WEB58_07665 [Planctomycetaceae bacterium]
MIDVRAAHPYEAITRFILAWIECLVRGEYSAADALVDEFEGDSRIGEYFAIEDEDGPMQAVDPRVCEWWQLSFSPCFSADRGVMVEAYVPLARDYRPMKACFVFVPVGDALRVKFQYCQPS